MISIDMRDDEAISFTEWQFDTTYVHGYVDDAEELQSDRGTLQCRIRQYGDVFYAYYCDDEDWVEVWTREDLVSYNQARSSLISAIKQYVDVANEPGYYKG